MRSFEHGYLLETAISHPLLMSMRLLGEFCGRQNLYAEQFPEVLDTLRQVALIQSTESSNRILDFECVHPFKDGNGRIGRLLTLLLLYQCGYEAGRYISLERIVEESKETYYDTLFQSSQRWHEAEHDLRPWWEYFVGTLTAAYKEFESRVGTLTTARGAKREMVRNCVARLPARFRIGDVQRACPGVSYATLQRAMNELRRDGRVRCLGRGRDAEWERIASWND